jgi:hypothetical protein
VNCLKGEDSLKKELRPGDYLWVSPWISDKVTINPSSDHIYASSYEMLFSDNQKNYEIGLNSPSGNEPYNYCCLTIHREYFSNYICDSQLSIISKK